MSEQSEHELFEIMEKMNEDRCPICALTELKLKNMMEHFLYECVNDREIRYKLAEVRGFCNAHAHMLKNIGDPLAHAILYKDLIEGDLLILNSSKKGKTDLSFHSNCQFCDFSNNCLSSYSKSFYGAFRNDAFKNMYENKSILCLSCLQRILKFKKIKNDKILQSIYELTLNKYGNLLHDLSEIARKHDYRYLDESWTSGEKDAWGKAVDLYNGASGIGK